MRVRFANEAIGDDEEPLDDEPVVPEESLEPEPSRDGAAQAYLGEALEAALQEELSEAAREADELEASGADPDAVSALDLAAEDVSEAMISLRVARAKAAHVRRVRGGGFPGNENGKASVPPPLKARHETRDNRIAVPSVRVGIATSMGI